MLLRYTPLPRSRLPLRRTPLRQRAKPKPPSVLHPNKRVPVSAREWQSLKMALFRRSGGFCEAWKGNEMCCAPITWYSFEPHHKKSRAHGGQDTLQNLLAVCHGCHQRIHGTLQWTRKLA